MIVVRELASADGPPDLYGNIAVRRLTLHKGQIMPGHSHRYDHASFIGAGRVTVTLFYQDGRAGRKTVDGPTWIEVPARAEHQFEALTDAVLFCVFAVRDEDGRVAEQVREEHLRLARGFAT